MQQSNDDVLTVVLLRRKGHWLCLSVHVLPPLSVPALLWQPEDGNSRSTSESEPSSLDGMEQKGGDNVRLSFTFRLVPRATNGLFKLGST